MKIAIAKLGKEEDSEISEKAGRAPYYLIYETDKLIEVWKNPFAIGGGGAGTSVAKVMETKGVKEVIASNFGEKMEAALKERDIITTIRS